MVELLVDQFGHGIDVEYVRHRIGDQARRDCQQHEENRLSDDCRHEQPADKHYDCVCDAKAGRFLAPLLLPVFAGNMQPTFKMSSWVGWMDTRLVGQ